jgi:hypothetical protein
MGSVIEIVNMLHDKKMAEKKQKGIYADNARKEAENQKKIDDRRSRYANMRQNLFSSDAGGFNTNDAKTSALPIQ